MDKEGIVLAGIPVVAVLGILFWTGDGCKKKGGMSGTWEYGKQGGSNGVHRLILGQGGKITERSEPPYGIGRSFHYEGTYWIEEGPPREIIFKVKKSNGPLSHQHNKSFFILDDGNIATGSKTLMGLLRQY